MTAALVDIAEAIRLELESINLSQSFDLYRSYGDWEDVLEDLETPKLRIDVVPNKCTATMINRSTHAYSCDVSVLLRKPIAKEERQNGRIKNSVIDQLVEDLQTVHEFFSPSQSAQNGRKLTAVPTANWQRDSDVMAPYSRKLLKAPGQYSGWVKVVYDVYKTLGS